MLSPTIIWLKNSYTSQCTFAQDTPVFFFTVIRRWFAVLYFLHKTKSVLIFNLICLDGLIQILFYLDLKKIILFSDKQADSITINTGCAAAVSLIEAMEEEI